MDLERGYKPGREWVARMIPKIRTLTLSAKLNPLLIKNLDFLLLGKIVDAYNGQTDGTRFRVSSSRWGLHIAPIQAHNSSGQLVTIKPIMDYSNYYSRSKSRSLHAF